jgi:hypothetical protein
MLVGRRVGAAQAEAYVLCSHAFAARTASRFSDAVEALDSSLRIFRSLGDVLNIYRRRQEVPT